MTTQQLQDNVNWLLLRASLLTKQRLMKISEEYDLTIMQAFTLCLLEPDNPVPMHSISGLLGCDPSNITGVVDRLSTGGYIERKESTADRRVKTIVLTDKGLKLRSDVLHRITDTNSPNLANLTTVDIEMLKQLLAKIIPDKPTS